MNQTKKVKTKKKMSNLSEKIENMLRQMGFKESDIRVKMDEEHKKVSLFIDDESVRGDNTPQILSAFNHLINQMLKKENQPHHVIDLNYYRKERERLITKLARAAARKATVTEENVELPPMNSYERRLVHVEIKTHPELDTESTGTGKSRRVVVKQLKEAKNSS